MTAGIFNFAYVIQSFYIILRAYTFGHIKKMLQITEKKLCIFILLIFIEFNKNVLFLFYLYLYKRVVSYKSNSLKQRNEVN